MPPTAAPGRTSAAVQVPVSVLGELAESLVAVHGQADQQRCSRRPVSGSRWTGTRVPRSQRCCELSDVSYERLREVDALLDGADHASRERLQEASALRYGLKEIEAVEPQPGEDVALAAESSDSAMPMRCAPRPRPRTAPCSSTPRTGGSTRSPWSAWLVARSDDERTHDPELAALADRLAEAGYLLADVAADLASYAASVDTDPRRLAAVEERRAALQLLTRKYGDSVDEVLAWADRRRLGWTSSTATTVRVADLPPSAPRSSTELAELAGQVSGARQAAAKRFAAA